jgi:hypothetical protein
MKPVDISGTRERKYLNGKINELETNGMNKILQTCKVA